MGQKYSGIECLPSFPAFIVFSNIKEKYRKKKTNTVIIK